MIVLCLLCDPCCGTPTWTFVGRIAQLTGIRARLQRHPPRADVAAPLQCSAIPACAREPADGTSVCRRPGSTSLYFAPAGSRLRPARELRKSLCVDIGAHRWKGEYRYARRGSFASRLALTPASFRRWWPAPRSRREATAAAAEGAAPRPEGDVTGTSRPARRDRTSRRAAGREPRRVSRRPGAEAWTEARQRFSTKRGISIPGLAGQ